MKRWKVGLLGLTLAVSGLAGCKQTLFEKERDTDHYRSEALKLGGPADLDVSINSTIQPALRDIPPRPPTIEDSDRPIRYMTLQEAFAIALEQGTTGFLTPSGGGLGQANENIQSGRSGTFSDSIRVLALDPAIAGADIDASLSKFDARYLASATWSKRDDAPLNVLNTFQNGDQFNLSSGLYKPMPTGGVVGITSTLDYLKSDSSNGTFVNPSYRPRVQLNFEQPLLQNYGVEINQLLVNHPGAVNIPRFRPPGGGRVEGILITRIRLEQAKAEFERNVNHMLLNVEAAYWNIYAGYGALFARNQALIEAYELWRNIKNRVEGGLQEPHDERRALSQLESFRVLRYQALGQVIENERQFRMLLGMTDDGTRIVPSDTPTKAPYEPDWYSAVNEALMNRPELVEARQDLKTRQFDILLQKNLLKPDLRFVANYDINGVGSRLDGSALDANGTSRNALASLSSDKFNSWQYGFQLDVPIGFRDAHSAARVARLNLLRSYAALRDNERKVTQQLRNQFSRLAEQLRTLEGQEAAYQAAQQQYELLRNRRDLQSLASTLEQLLTAQQTVSGARVAYFRAEADYNTSLAGFQFAKGTIMQYDNVVASEGPLPEYAQVRATDHFRERAKAIKLRERPAGETGPTGTGDGSSRSIMRDPLCDVMPIATEAPQSVPQMMMNMPRPPASATTYGSAAPVSGPRVVPNSAPAMMPGPVPGTFPSVPGKELPGFNTGLPQRPASVSPAGYSGPPGTP